jgi:hypothetical protein
MSAGGRGSDVLAGYLLRGGRVDTARVVQGTMHRYAGRVVRGGDSTAVAGAWISLVPWDEAARFVPRDGPSDLAAITDSTGAFSIAGIPPGDYAVTVDVPKWEVVGGLRHQELLRETDLRTGGRKIVILPGLEQLFERLCPRIPLHRNSGAIVGRVLGQGDSTKLPTIGAAWVVSRMTMRAGEMTVSDAVRRAAGRMLPGGGFVICGVPVMEDVVVRIGGEDSGVGVLVDERIVWQDVRMP